MGTGLESLVSQSPWKGSPTQAAFPQTGSSNKMPTVRQPLFSPVSQEYLSGVRKGSLAFRARQPSSPLPLPILSSEEQEEQVVGFISATTGLRELAVAIVHLDSD